MILSGAPELIGHLSSTLGLEDLHDLVEIKQVDAENAARVRKALEDED